MRLQSDIEIILHAPLKNGRTERHWLPMMLRILLLAPLLSIAQTNEWSSRADMPTPRHALTGCVIEGLLYAIGGYAGANAPPLSVVEIYDPAADSWSSGPSLPVGRRQLTSGVVDGKCYVIGGRTTSGAFANGTSIVDVLDPITGTWSTRADIPTARVGAGSAEANGRIYVFGGGPSPANIGGFLEIYDPDTDSWSIGPNMPTVRAFPAGAAVDGRVYAIGGTLDPSSGDFAVVEVFDPATDRWSRVADMPTSRWGATASVAGGKIYVFGGNDGGSGTVLDVVEEYDPVSDTWTTLTPMPRGRGLVPISAAIGEHVFVVGGSLLGVPPHPAVSTNEAYGLPVASFSINQGVAGAWFNPATDGQGFLIDVDPVSQFMFVAWFTYETASAKVGAPEHRWLIASGNYSENRAELVLFATSGGLFDDPQTVSTSTIGTMKVDFVDCGNGLVEYDLPGDNLQGQIPIARAIPGSEDLCQILGAADQ